MRYNQHYFDMIVNFKLNNAPIVLDASADEIRAALDNAIRENEEFYQIAVAVTGTYLAERVGKEAKAAKSRASMAKAGKVSTAPAKGRNS